MKDIIIFGGTFNPIHLGHIEIIKNIARDTEDTVLVMPSKIPPHKVCNDLASDNDRLQMCKIACADIPNVIVSEAELLHQGKSYTVETLKRLKKEHSDKRLTIVIGGDMLVTFKEWYKFKEILAVADIIAVRRVGVDDKQFDEAVIELINMGGRITVEKNTVIGISSTEIKQNINNDEYLKKYLPQVVIDYIKNNGLYIEENADYEKYKQILKDRLFEKRYLHSLAVADEAKRLAIKYGADSEKAYFAGLLHDITKNTKAEEQLKIFNDFGIILDDVSMGSEKLWHAVSGAAYCKHVLGITDDEILSAIRYHTTAKADMTMLQKILYVADFTSRDRDYDDVDIMREKADISLEDALDYGLSYTMKDLIDMGRQIHPDTFMAYNSIKEKKHEI